HSGRLPTSVITTSPRRIPRAASVPARRAARSATCAKLTSSREPSRLRATKASRLGGAFSTTSSAKFIPGGIVGGRKRPRGNEGFPRDDGVECPPRRTRVSGAGEPGFGANFTSRGRRSAQALSARARQLTRQAYERE